MTMLWLAKTPLILASQSAVRRSMLEAAGIPIEIHPADIDERAVETSAGLQDPSEVALLLAREKAKKVAANWPGRLIVGADQTLALEGRRFSKPADQTAGRTQLRALAGRTHELHSAVVLAQDGIIRFACVETATLTMRPLSEDFLDAYVKSAGRALTTSVGGYQLEGLGIQLFERIEGDHFAILGLPLLALLAHLRKEGCLVS